MSVLTNLSAWNAPCVHSWDAQLKVWSFYHEQWISDLDWASKRFCPWDWITCWALWNLVSAVFSNYYFKIWSQLALLNQHSLHYSLRSTHTHIEQSKSQSLDYCLLCQHTIQWGNPQITAMWSLLMGQNLQTFTWNWICLCNETICIHIPV